MARRREWQDFSFDLDIASGASPVIDLSRFTDNEGKGATLVRIIVDLNIIPILFGQNAGVQQVSYGIGLTGQDAVSAAGASVADPGNPTDFPPSGWLVRSKVPVNDDGTPGYPTPIVKLDLRAQRKLMYGTPFIRFDNTAQQGVAFSVTVVGFIRCLYLLP